MKKITEKKALMPFEKDKEFVPLLERRRDYQTNERDVCNWEEVLGICIKASDLLECLKEFEYRMLHVKGTLQEHFDYCFGELPAEKKELSK